MHPQSQTGRAPQLQWPSKCIKALPAPKVNTKHALKAKCPKGNRGGQAHAGRDVARSVEATPVQGGSLQDASSPSLDVSHILHLTGTKLNFTELDALSAGTAPWDRALTLTLLYQQGTISKHLRRQKQA